MLANLLSILLAFFGWIFRRRTQGEKVIDTIIDERNDALEKVRKADETLYRVEHDPDYRDWMYRKYKREGD